MSNLLEFASFGPEEILYTSRLTGCLDEIEQLTLRMTGLYRPEPGFYHTRDDMRLAAKELSDIADGLVIFAQEIQRASEAYLQSQHTEH